MNCRQRIVALVVVMLTIGTMRTWGGENDDRIEQLSKRLAELEKRVAQLEGKSKNAPAPDDIDRIRQNQKTAARKRMAKDRGKYSPQEVAEAEQLYQVANKNWRAAVDAH